MGEVTKLQISAAMKAQLSFLKSQKTSFGGTLLKGNPRIKRPLSTKKPIHLVLKSSKAKGRRSFLAGRSPKRIQLTINKFAKIYGIRIYRYNNVGNHIHLVLKINKLRAYPPFIRAITGRIAQGMMASGGWETKTFQISNIGTKTAMGKQVTARSKETRDRFWDYRPFSRVITWGKEFLALSDYSLKNDLDVLGIARTEYNLKWLKETLRRQRWVLSS